MCSGSVILNVNFAEPCVKRGRHIINCTIAYNEINNLCVILQMYFGNYD